MASPYNGDIFQSHDMSRQGDPNDESIGFRPSDPMIHTGWPSPVLYGTPFHTAGLDVQQQFLNGSGIDNNETWMPPSPFLPNLENEPGFYPPYQQPSPPLYSDSSPLSPDGYSPSTSSHSSRTCSWDPNHMVTVAPGQTAPSVPYGKNESFDRPFECNADGCGRRFKTQHTLRLHMESHKNKRPTSFNCTMGCSENFTRQHDRLRHEVAKHGKVCEWSCEHCRRFFSTQRTLAHHRCPVTAGSTRWVN